MKPSTVIKGKRELILEIAARHGASNVRVFGSVARGEDTSRSDLDLLVDMEEERPLSDLGEFSADVEEFLRCRVQVVTADTLNRRIRDRILTEAVPL